MNGKKSYIIIFICVISVLFLSAGCQKVINIDLNSASPAIVIVGNINDQPGPYTVTLSQTVNFSEPNTFPAVNGAFITIADNAGTVDTLFETSIPGTYNTKKIMGVAGRTYTLTVISNGQTYTSVSTMPQAVAFDTLIVIQRIGGGYRGGSDTSYRAEAAFQDPSVGMHYYRFIETLNDTVLSNIDCIDDQLSAGKYITYSIRAEGHSLLVGDSVKIEMQCIDQGTYQYLSTMGEASGSTNVTPSNPVSNISNNALGYFSAHTSRYRSVLIVR
ncbi:MAG: DUF4249 domain-containing protein [Bacteroidia bacterium]